MDSSCVPSTSCYADRSLNVRAGVVRRFLIGAHSVHSTTHPWRKAPTDLPNLLFVGPFRRDRSVVWILKYRLTRCTFHRQPPRWMQAAGWDRERISHARTPTVDQYPSFRTSRTFCSPCTFSVSCFAVSRSFPRSMEI